MWKPVLARLVGSDKKPISSSSPLPVQYFPKLLVVAGGGASSVAVAGRPANQAPYSANDAVSNHATAASVAAITFAASDLADAPVLLTALEILTADTGPATAGATFEAEFYNADPTASTGVQGGDNAAYSQKRAGYVGRMQGIFTACADGSKAILTPVEGNFIITAPLSGGLTLYVPGFKTLTAFTSSANSTVFACTLRGIQGRA
jgi:hypothetical protein